MYFVTSRSNHTINSKPNWKLLTQPNHLTLSQFFSTVLYAVFTKVHSCTKVLKENQGGT